MSLETSREQLQSIGQYDLLAKIAEGGMGAVHKARHHMTGAVVAIKIVPPETARNPLLIKRFEQEFKAACLIDHPNVVKALDFSGAAPSPFLVMEFVDGESLGQRVERDGAMPEAEAVRLISQVCEGLHRAHKQGLIHRDVKPDNILVTPDGVAKLTDLGLVKDIEAESNLTRTGRGLGTPHFMAPEQFRNAKMADVRCDVYSLGATLYMLVTGQVPFARTTPLDCWLKKTKNDFPEARQFVPRLSERTNWAICRAMSADPTRRPASCREFMEDLTGGNWRASQSGRVPASATTIEDLWYMVYRDRDGRPHTVKGSTESIRRNVAIGSLGEVSAILVSRTKTGQFQPLRDIPEFRDLVVGPAPASDRLSTPALQTGRLSTTSFDPPTRTAPVSSQATPPPVRLQYTDPVPADGLPTPRPCMTAADPTEYHPPTTEPFFAEPLGAASASKSGFNWTPWLLLIAVVAAGAAGLAFLLK
jgi:serine/threonine protein kinase